MSVQEKDGNISYSSSSLSSILSEIAAEVKREYKFFPAECCRYSSEKVQGRLNLDIAYGYYIDSDELGNEHYWNLNTRTGMLIDITAKQFDKSLPEILMIPLDSEYVRKHYICLHYSDKDTMHITEF